ncbi:MAG: Aminotransferase, partial [Mycetocola sp.]|nr:Aminotransferase [Mycetocola sp.]
MYSRDLEDPGGNILELGHMDPVAAEKGQTSIWPSRARNPDARLRFGAYGTRYPFRVSTTPKLSTKISAIAESATLKVDAKAKALQAQ